MNNVILRGRLTEAPEVRVTAEEKSTTIARYTLAVADRTHRNSNGEYDTDFIKCVSFNSVASTLEQFCGKGSEVLVTGRLHCYTYKNKEDRNVYMTEVICERVEFINGCKKPDVEIPDGEDDELPFK